MHQQNPLRIGISASFRAAGLMVGMAVFVGACAGESDAANEQTGSNQVNQRTAPLQANAARRAGNGLLTGVAAKGDWTTDAPGVRRKLTPADLPAPYATDSVSNRPNKISQPQGAMPRVAAGFRVEKFADRLKNPRMIRAAPEYVDFMTGFVTPEGEVWGRPVAVAVGRDGALFVSDDGGNVIWRVSYPGGKGSAGMQQP